MTQEHNTDKENNIVQEPQYTWGGPWTEQKLDAFEKYVRAYLTIMKKYAPKFGWELFYFDAFAGSGSREQKETSQENNNSLFDEDATLLDEINNQSNYKGAAERVIGIEGFNFNWFYFVDKENESLDKLRIKLTEKFPEKKGQMAFKQGDANIRALELVNYTTTHKNTVALVLLDPFGMQLKWTTIEALSKIQHIDLWILLPSGVIINRLLKKNGELMFPERLTDVFGLSEEHLHEYFYTQRKEMTLFGEESISQKREDSINLIAQLYIKRLKTLFAYVSEEPLILQNTRGHTIFHFVFASHNKTAKGIAKDIVGKKNYRI